MSINKDKLIRSMYKRPILWNHKHSEYRNAVLKQQAWSELAIEFNTSDEILKKKWACIRDTFRRELRKILIYSTETSPYVPKWPFFEKMLFLKDTMDARKSFIDETEERQPDDFQESNSMVFEEDNVGEKEELSESKTLLHSYAFGTNFVQGDYENTPDYQEVENGSRKRSSRVADIETDNEFMESSMKSKKIKLSNEEDEDYHFVMSILPSLRKVSNKLKVRMDIMSVIMAAEQNST